MCSILSWPRTDIAARCGALLRKAPNDTGSRFIGLLLLLLLLKQPLFLGVLATGDATSLLMPAKLLQAAAAGAMVSVPLPRQPSRRVLPLPAAAFA
jgi:hypothetical protein